MLILEKITRFIRKFSIYNRLIISFIFIATIPSLIIGYYSINISSKEMVAKISSSSVQALKIAETNIDGKLKLYEALAKQISKDKQIIGLLKTCSDLKKTEDVDLKENYEASKIKIGQLLYQYAASSDANNIEILTDEDEFNQYDNYDIKVGASLVDASDYRKKDSYQQAINMNGWPLWTDTSQFNQDFQIVSQGTTYLGNYLTLSTSIEDNQSNKTLGVIIITVPTMTFKQLIDLENMYDKNEIVFLMGTEGIVMILNGIYIFNMPDQLILKEITSIQEGNIIKTIGDKQYILTFRPIGKTDMTVVYMVERDKALNSVYRLREVIIKVILGCIICAMLFAYFVTISISKPLNNLKRTMARVEEDGLDFEYEDHSKDEIGILGQRFNYMIVGVKKLMEEFISTELSRKDEGFKRKQAELDALQMQIKDHFLYNTLDLIRWNAMIVENGNGTLSQMIADFSVLLRFSTKSTNKLVEINEEVEHARAYIKVLQFKKEKNITLIIDIKDQEIFHNKITKLTFQPIVENAVKYRFDDPDKDVIICLSARICENSLFVEIRDNGKGMSNELQKQLNHELQMEDYKEGSIGLRNVNKRIKLNFGSEYGLKIESEEDKYTSVSIHIPNIKQ